MLRVFFENSHPLANVAGWLGHVIKEMGNLVGPVVPANRILDELTYRQFNDDANYLAYKMDDKTISHITSHFARASGATAHHKAGGSPELLKFKGDWDSSQYMSYIDFENEDRGLGHSTYRLVQQMIRRVHLAARKQEHVDLKKVREELMS